MHWRVYGKTDLVPVPLTIRVTDNFIGRNVKRNILGYHRIDLRGAKILIFPKIFQTSRLVMAKSSSHDQTL